MDSKEVRKLYMMEFGLNLKKVRERQDITLDDIATDSTFDSSNYHKFEQGTRNPTIETILKIATVLKVHPRDLFDFPFDLSKNKIDM